MWKWDNIRNRYSHNACQMFQLVTYCNLKTDDDEKFWLVNSIHSSRLSFLTLTTAWYVVPFSHSFALINILSTPFILSFPLLCLQIAPNYRASMTSPLCKSRSFWKCYHSLYFIFIHSNKKNRQAKQTIVLIETKDESTNA